MMIRHAWAAIALPLLFAGLARAEIEYTLVDLGGLGGGEAHGFDLNATGHATGYSTDPHYDTHGFLYSDGAMSDIGTLGGDFSAAYGINDAAQIVGYSVNADGRTRAFRWTPGGTPAEMFELGTLGGWTSSARDINNAGMIVGTSVGSELLAQNRAFLWTPTGGDPTANDGTMISLGVIDPGTFQARSQAEAVNDNSVVVGDCKVGINFHAFRWADGLGMIDLGTLGGTTSHAYDVNNDGYVVGVALTDTGRSRAFKWFDTNDNNQADDGEMVDLGTIESDPTHDSTAFGINGLGDVVGWSDTSGTPHAFVYNDGTVRDLNALIDPATGWELIEARAINDAGMIVGRGNAPGRSGQAFLLVPIVDNPIPGDANGDTRVDQTDAAILADHWLQNGVWADGDFNGDGLVDLADASILAAQWGTGAENTTGVPEPACLILVLGGLLVVAVRRAR